MLLSAFASSLACRGIPLLQLDERFGEIPGIHRAAGIMCASLATLTDC
jgi:hypothetical protein